MTYFLAFIGSLFNCVGIIPGSAIGEMVGAFTGSILVSCCGSELAKKFAQNYVK